MIQKCKKDRINAAYNYLYDNGFVHSITELAKKMNRARPGVSNALSGDPKYLNDSFVTAFATTFNVVSLDWLLTGNGDMLKNAVPDDSQNSGMVDQSSLINAAIAAKDETIRSKDETIASLRETIESLKQQISMLRNQANNEMFTFPIGVAEEPANLKANQ